LQAFNSSSSRVQHGICGIGHLRQHIFRRGSKKALKKIFKTNVKRAHDYLGHLSKDTTRMMAKYLGMILSRGLSPVCKSCAIAKAKQRNIPKETSGENKATEFNG
jgi:hypothetical protein